MEQAFIAYSAGRVRQSLRAALEMGGSRNVPLVVLSGL
jgi:hypothetical protein